jgi:hypothetical protein
LPPPKASRDGSRGKSPEQNLLPHLEQGRKSSVGREVRYSSASDEGTRNGTAEASDSILSRESSAGNGNGPRRGDGL